MNKKVVFAGLLLGALLTWVWQQESSNPFLSAPAGFIDREPTQTPTDKAPFLFPSLEWWSHTYRIIPIASYVIQGRVLHAKRYYSDDYTAGLVPFDMGLGWKAMSERSLLHTYFTFDHVGQSGGARLLWVRWREGEGGSYRVPPPEIGDEMKSLSNNHLIPADKKVFRQLAQVRAGDLVQLKGLLVNVEDPDNPGWVWTTSQNRTDTSDHWGGDNTSCETIFVTQVDRILSTEPLKTEPFSEGIGF